MTNPENHGKPWSTDHYSLLFHMYYACFSIEEIAQALRRSRYAVVRKLVEAHVVTPDGVLRPSEMEYVMLVRDYYVSAACGEHEPARFPPHSYELGRWANGRIQK